MAKASNKASALLDLIHAPTEPSLLEGLPGSVGAPALHAGSRKGKRVTIFLHDGDRRIIRELMAYLAGQGRRVSESIAIKAALRMAKPGTDLLVAHEQAAAQDQRFKTR